MMDVIATKSKTIQILNKFQIVGKKRYGQNFIIDEKVIDKIILQSKITKTIGVIEIGPGIGALTQALIQHAGKVVGIEIDKTLINVLKNLFIDKDNFLLINNDFLKIDLNKLINDEFSGYESIYIISNIPYYITSKIIEKILDCENKKIKKTILMMQEEVAMKIVKKSNTVTSYLKLLLDIRTESKILFSVSKNAFLPSPKVDSIILENNFKTIVNPSKKRILQLAKEGFVSKRKTLVNNINTTKFTKEKIKLLLIENGFKENVRIEELSIRDLDLLSDVLQY